uniref:Monoacylglycerol O-acyltransferase 3 n=1 Tax=Nomascus leucogenys TaxID=61853 RepID=G1R9X0_NOMLE
MGVATALPPPATSKTLQKQHLEAVGAYQYVLTFLFMGPFFSLLVFVLLFTSLWPFSVFYLVWLYVDWDTPNQGGRRSEWIRNQAIWRQLRDYYPVKVMEIQPPRPPKVLGLQQMGTTFHLLLPTGLCPVSRQSLDFILSQPQLGQAVVIMVGGAHEALYSVPGEHCLTLQKRKGFVRLALRHGASLVPMYSFGENDIFRLKAFATGSWQHWCQLTFKKLTGFSPCIFWGRGLFSATSWGLLPFAVPITTVGECPPPGGWPPAAAWWAAPSPSPSASTPLRQKSITIMPST